MITVLIVLYNRIPEDSETCISLLALSRNRKKIIDQVILWDNSSAILSTTKISAFAEAMIPSHVRYVGDGKNYPLSFVYNHIIEFISRDDILVIFDHDSTFNDEYFIKLFSAIEENPDINLFVPQIYRGDLLMSPALNYYYIGKYFNGIKPGQHSSSHMFAINSGMAIRGKYLKGNFEGWNPKLKFYGTDNDFMFKYQRDNERLYVLDVTIQHILNSYDITDMMSYAQRFKSQRDAAFINMESQNFLIQVRVRMYYWLLTIKLCLKHRTLSFV